MKNTITLLPVYCKDKLSYFISAFKSLLHQTYQSDILIIVDGEINVEFKSYINKSKSNNIRVLFFPTNRGLAAVLNDGIKYAFEHGYEFIARMDADDISMPDRFEKQMNFLLQHPEVDVVGGAIEEIDENGQSLGKVIHYPLTHQECFRFFAARDPLAHPAVMFRRRFFEKAVYNNKEIDVIVLPSLYEGIPVSLMEAMAYQIPVISTRVGGTPELLNENAGILVAPADSQSLAMTMLELALNVEKRKLYAKAGREKVMKEFNLLLNTERLVSIFSNYITKAI
ncbi:MAG TPA: glycosyltransferase [Bacteroidales bacterium]|nr:glycosyltransferase [Bacteroidales bacterium]